VALAVRQGRQDRAAPVRAVLGPWPGCTNNNTNTSNNNNNNSNNNNSKTSLCSGGSINSARPLESSG
jgi:hypothetical protein